MSSSTDMLYKKYSTLSVTLHCRFLSSGWFKGLPDWSIMGLTLNNSRTHSFDVLRVRTWCTNIGLCACSILGNLSDWSTGFNVEHASVEGDLESGERVSGSENLVSASYEFAFMTGHDLTRDIPPCDCFGLWQFPGSKCLRRITGLTSASVGESDRARPLMLRGFDFCSPLGSGLEKLRWILRTAARDDCSYITVSSILFWGTNRERKGDSGRESAPLTSLSDPDLRSWTESKICIKFTRASS